jgi:adenosine deaminase
MGHWLSVNGYRQRTAIKSEMSIRDVVDAVNRGLARGQRDYKVTVRSVLTLIRTKPQWSADIVNVAIETRQDGVVGIDMIGDVFGVTSPPNEGTTQNGT